MTIILNNISVALEEGKGAAVTRALSFLGIPPSAVESAALAKCSVDARKINIKLVCSVEIGLNSEGEALLSQRNDLQYTVKSDVDLTFVKGKTPLPSRPVVVGFGPAGMFAALLLAQNGYRPIVLERGRPIEERALAVEDFWKTGKLLPDCNVQFGEGGAGAFSDGKLTTRINDPLCGYVLKELIKQGAPKEISTLAKPHIGTDLLRQIVKSVREAVIAEGGDLRFGHAATEFITQSGKLKELSTPSGKVEATAAIVAVGHSARDTFEALERSGATIIPKAFSVGARIEHLQTDIDTALYGGAAGHENLPHGEYQLSYREGERAAYTFCMCPGGMVVAAASDDGQVVTNGMSYHSRAMKNANSALAVSVSTEDYGSGWRDGIAFQQKLERMAFTAGGGNFAAPITTVGRLLGTTGGNKVEPSYPLGVKEYPIEELFPTQIRELFIKSLPILGRKLRCFDSPSAILTGVETRTSSPIRVIRGENFCATGVDGLYPCGEGAGYAGGIMSAAVDGLRCAMAIMERWAPFTE